MYSSCALGRRQATLILLATAIAPTPVGAVPLTIANPSFETPVQADGGFDFLILPAQQGAWGWIVDDGSFVYNPQAGDYTGAGGNGTPLGADGSQVGGVFGFGDYGISQRLAGADAIPGNTDDPVVRQGMVYTLTFSVGQRAAGNPFGATWGGYDVQLLAGAGRSGILLRRETDVVIPPPGEFVTRTLTIVCPTFSHPDAAGLPLTILLRKTTVNGSATVEYDNIRLDATEISPIHNADFDNSGLVDVADLSIWKDHFGANCLDATHDHGNANGSDVVDGGDLLQWQRELGSAPAVLTIPEPGIGAIVALLLVSTACTRSGCRAQRNATASNQTARPTPTGLPARRSRPVRSPCCIAPAVAHLGG